MFSFTSNFKSSINKYYLFFHIMLSGSLIIVDNMHFQYNSFLYGIFIFSISHLIRKNYITSALIFTITLNFKHIFLYFAPAYFVIMLKYYVFSSKTNSTIKKICFSVIKLIALVFVVTLVTGISFLPFILISNKNNSIDQFKQIFHRLFPVSRGLLHSYWAPNIFALYSFIDKCLYKILIFTNNKYLISVIGKLNFNVLNKTFSSLNTSASGKVQVTNFNILPNISVMESNVLVVSLSLMLIIYYILSKYPSTIKEINNKIFKILFLSGVIFFNFGYHVHEKAIISLSIILLLWSYSNSTEIVEELKTKEDSKPTSIENIQEEEKQRLLEKNELLIENIKGAPKDKGLQLHKRPRFFFFFGSKDEILMTSTFELELISLFTQLPLTHNIEDYYVKFFLISVLLIIKYITLKHTICKYLSHWGFLYKLLIILFIICLVFTDFIYVIVIPSLKSLSQEEKKYYINFALNKLKTTSMFNDVKLLEFLYLRFDLVIDTLIKFEFVPLMVFSVINSYVLQLNIYKLLCYA